MIMCEKRYHIEVEPGCTGTFSTPTPSPETLRILKDVIRMAKDFEDRRVSDQSGREAGPKDGTHAERGPNEVRETPK